MAWIVLVLSGLMETVWATALAQSDGFRNMRMILVFLVAMVASMAGLGYALRELPVGTAYAVWTGIGAVGTALFGIAFLGEPASVGRIVCLALIVSGIVGLETAFPALFTKLVLPGRIPLGRLLYAMCDAPRARFGIPGGLGPGAARDLALIDLAAEWTVDPANFLSKGRSTPFEGMRLRGEAALTMVGGQIAWRREGFEW